MIESMEKWNRIYSYLFYSLSAAGLALSLLFYNIYLFLAALFLMPVAALCFSSGHIVNSLLIKRSNIIEVYNGYKVSSNLDSAVRHSGNRYYSVSMAVLVLRKPFLENSELVKNLIESIREPFEFSIRLREAGKERILDGLETRRRMKEIALSKMRQPSDRASELKREVAVIGNEIEVIRKGGKILEMTILLSAFGESASESEASRESAFGIRKVADSFTAALGVESEILRGEALISSLEARP